MCQREATKFYREPLRREKVNYSYILVTIHDVSALELSVLSFVFVIPVNLAFPG